MAILLLFTLSCSLNEEPITHKKASSQSKPTQVTLGVPPSPIGNSISPEMLFETFECSVELTDTQIQQFTAAMNLSSPPCEPCFQIKSFAECIVDKEACDIATVYAKSSCILASKDKEYTTILEQLKFQDLWFEALQPSGDKIHLIVVTNHQHTVVNYLDTIQPLLQNSNHNLIVIDTVNNNAHHVAETLVDTQLSDLILGSAKSNAMRIWNKSVVSIDNAVYSHVLSLKHRSYPTLYIGGHRVRGMQSQENLNYLVEMAKIQQSDSQSP
ncbi:MAG: hypothetical protein ACON4U_01365 [Myxococcota bacterium]